MDYLREGIGLRAMAQRDPLVEYQREGYDMFNSMMDGIREESVGNLFNLQFEIQENPIVEEVGSGAQLAFGGALPGVTAGGAPQQAAAPAPAPAAQAPAPAAPARHARSAPPPAPAPEPEPAAPPAAFGKKQAASQQAASQQAGTRSRGRHAANGRGHATAAGRGQAATRSSGARAAEPATADVAEVTDTVPESTGPQPVLPAGFEPNRPRSLQYSAPAEGGGVELHGETALDPYANVGRNDLCPCGSGRKYKRCHGGRQQ
jgi:preprotein translocase subunit SecA